PIRFVFKDQTYTLIEVNNRIELSIIEKLNNKFDSLSNISNFQLGNDFHKTNDSNLFEPLSNYNIPLFEGKFINLFVVNKDVTDSISLENVQNRVGEAFSEFRIAIRTVASSTNQRSLISTLLPRNSSGTHSLHIQRKS